MSGYEVYGVCDQCGYYQRAPFGSLSHIHREVCPDCGRDKDRWNLVTGRVRNVGTFWHRRSRVIPLTRALSPFPPTPEQEKESE